MVQASALGTVLERLEVSAFKIPTEAPESDAATIWDFTTIVIVEAHCDGRCGLGYTYADAATAKFIHDELNEVVLGHDCMDVPGAWEQMVRSVHQLGRPGVASLAISAVDTALWDLKARLLDLPLASLLGRVREAVPIYGSGGFTSFSATQLSEQLAGWVNEGITRVKMKVGRQPEHDVERVRIARRAIRPETELFVDADGAYNRKQALAQAEAFAPYGVRWLEEFIPDDDLDGLHLLRDRAPAGMEIAAGERGCELPFFRHLLEAEAVDVLQADITRCGGLTGFLQVAALSHARSLDLSTSGAPALHLHPACAVHRLRHAEYYCDHVRVEQMLFDGVSRPQDGLLFPDLSRPGNGLEFKRDTAQPYVIWEG
jgi:L-alanine-DL-glutamate epimerase-like enolase superfamily enzyme